MRGFVSQRRVKMMWVLFVLVLLPQSIADGVHRCPCMPHASLVTSSSAVLRWKDPGSVGVIDYKVNCRGVCYYVSVDGRPMTKEDELTHFVPGEVDHVLLSDLQPNFNYSCTIVAEKRFARTRTSRPFYFSTHYAAPRPPQAPTIQQSGPLTEVHLYPTSTEHGPIRGYEVHFYVLDGISPPNTKLPNIPQQFFTQSEPLASLKTAQKSSRPLSFRITYVAIGRDSPTSLLIGSDLLHHALKNGTLYCVVTVSYTNPRSEEPHTTPLYSASQPSNPFTAIGSVGTFHSQHSTRRRSGRTVALVITTGAVMPAVVIGYISCIGVFILYREQQRIKYRPTEPRIVDDDNDDVISLCDSTSAMLNYSDPTGPLVWAEKPRTHGDTGTTTFELSVTLEESEHLNPSTAPQRQDFAATGHQECEVSFDDQSKGREHSLVLQTDSFPSSSRVTSLPILTTVSSLPATTHLVGSDHRASTTGTCSQSDSQTPKHSSTHVQPDPLKSSIDLSRYETEEFYSAHDHHDWLEDTRQHNVTIPPTTITSGNSTVTSGRDLRSQISSNVFLPRGFSQGFHVSSLSRPPGRTGSTGQTGPTSQTGMGELLRFDSGAGDQTDHAPELEMDLFELIADL